MVSMNSRIYIPMVFYHNYVWYCCHLRWGIWSELNKSWFSDHEVKKNRQVVNYCSKQFLIAVSLHMHAHIFDKYQSFQALLLGIKCRVWIVLTERVLGTLRQLSVIHPVSLCVQTSTVAVEMSIGISTLHYWGRGHDRMHHRQVHTTYHWSTEIYLNMWWCCMIG